MIKKYKEFITESLLDKIQGPTKNEIFNLFKEDHNKILSLADELNLLDDDDIKKIIDDQLKSYPFENKNVINNWLLRYCRYGIPYGIERTVEMGADINFNDYYPLYYAMCDNRYYAIKKLIELGVSLKGNEWIVNKAINNISNLSKLNKMLKLLLENGAILDHKKEHINRTVRMYGSDGVEYFEIMMIYGEKITFRLFRNLAHFGNLLVIEAALNYIDKSWISDGLIDSMDDAMKNCQSTDSNIKIKEVKELLKLNKVK